MALFRLYLLFNVLGPGLESFHKIKVTVTLRCEISKVVFLCPRHEMAEGHIEFNLSVCVCVFQNRVRAIT